MATDRPVLKSIPSNDPKQPQRQFYTCPECLQEVGWKDIFCRWCGVKFADLEEAVL